MTYKILVNNLKDTQVLANKLALFLSPHDIVTLSGDLGAGKTTLVSQIAKKLGVKEEVISPTFNILKCYYSGAFPIYHIDAYRLENENIDIGLEEFIEGDGLALIEWPIFIKPLLNADHLEIVIKNKGGNKREISFKSNAKHYDEIIRKLKS